ncbi:MAG: SH3 domain-containing protein [Pseudolabrys sp.]|jgi:uncharacterized protein YraI
MRLKQFVLASGVLLLSVGGASAAVVTDNLNLRSGPGIRHAIIDAIPAGASVQVQSCGASWCRVVWNGQEGYASRNYLARGGSAAYASYTNQPESSYESYKSYAYQPESSYESYAYQPGQYYDTRYCPYYGSNSLWWCH